MRSNQSYTFKEESDKWIIVNSWYFAYGEFTKGDVMTFVIPPETDRPGNFKTKAYLYKFDW